MCALCIPALTVNWTLALGLREGSSAGPQPWNKIPSVRVKLLKRDSRLHTEACWASGPCCSPDPELRASTPKGTSFLSRLNRFACTSCHRLPWFSLYIKQAAGCTFCLPSAGLITVEEWRFPHALLHMHLSDHGGGHFADRSKGVIFLPGEVVISDPKMWMQPKLLQVPRRKVPSENKVLLFSLAFHSFPHMIGSRKPCQLGKVFTTLELSKPY